MARLSAPQHQRSMRVKSEKAEDEFRVRILFKKGQRPYGGIRTQASESHGPDKKVSEADDIVRDLEGRLKNTTQNFSKVVGTLENSQIEVPNLKGTANQIRKRHQQTGSSSGAFCGAS